ncbi:hypothetical protein PybrP1_001290 [[Pythium] brassicae (nom. inval.)]|nr:hypothetical protein PybrP1_001290 [[Pythium] brassicae (nom. inval.)]
MTPFCMCLRHNFVLTRLRKHTLPSGRRAMKLRVLCLHGFRQTGDKLRVRISGFRRAFKSSVEFVCVDAPLVVPYEPTVEEHAKRHVL